MTDIEAKALALLNEIELERGATPYSKLNRHGGAEALCRAIEQHEAFEQKVSDAVGDTLFMLETHCDAKALVLASNRLLHFIIPKPKPDPLERLLSVTSSLVDKETLRDRLEAEGLEIREKRQ